MRFVALRYRGVGGLSLRELESFGAEGLLAAVERFDPSRGLKFSTYAAFYIRGSIIKGINEELRSVRGLPKNERVLSLDAPVAPGGDVDPVPLGELCADRTAKDPQLEVERDHLRQQMRGVVARLPPEERRVLTLRHGLNGEGPMGLAEVAEEIDVSVKQVRKVESRALLHAEAEMRRIETAA